MLNIYFKTNTEVLYRLKSKVGGQIVLFEANIQKFSSLVENIRRFL